MNYNATQSTAPKAPAPAMTYICAECGSDNEIKPKEPIRCKECGYRIMYKKRTKRSTFPFFLLLLWPFCCCRQNCRYWWLFVCVYSGYQERNDITRTGHNLDKYTKQRTPTYDAFDEEKAVESEGCACVCVFNCSWQQTHSIDHGTDLDYDTVRMHRLCSLRNALEHAPPEHIEESQCLTASHFCLIFITYSGPVRGSLRQQRETFLGFAGCSGSRKGQRELYAVLKGEFRRNQDVEVKEPRAYAHFFQPSFLSYFFSYFATPPTLQNITSFQTGKTTRSLLLQHLRQSCSYNNKQQHHLAPNKHIRSHRKITTNTKKI